ncbi:hypothetical protein LDENG_00151770 [Lucifuga dentata]|nr:hypothetical protein LDENG_00151770 [Lucifuga dentata]
MAVGSAQTSWIIVFVLSVSAFKVTEGGVALLSCQYSVKRNILVQTDENGIVSKVADRYRLTGDVLEGQMDLFILDVKRTDSGPYCCRVDIDGIFNDKKVIMNLRVVRAPIISSTPTTTTTTNDITEPLNSTVNWKTLMSSHLDLLRRNSTLLHLDTVTVKDSLPALSLQVNVPVLSLSLSVSLLVAAALLVLAFKHEVHRKALKTNCFSPEEPPHIIYQIRMQQPVQENIYTFD